MDKCKIFKIIQLSILLFGLTEKIVLAEEMDSQEENVATEEDEESDFEPMKELPNVRPICPNLNRALDLSVNKYKVHRVKIYEPFFKNFKIGVETSSLCKDLWYVIAKRKEKNRDYNFDFHGRIGMLWRGNFYIGGDGGFSTGKDCIWEGEDEYESKKIGERVSSTFTSKASRARHCGGVPPLGYDVIEEKLVINESEEVIVKSIFEMYLAGFSYQKMADNLNSKGLLTKAGRPFTKNSFHDILRQKKYVGTYIWNRRQAKQRRGKGNNHAEKPLDEQVKVEGGCPQIIDDETFQMVQEKLAGRQNGTADSKSRRHYMLGGLKILKCKE